MVDNAGSSGSTVKSSCSSMLNCEDAPMAIPLSAEALPTQHYTSTTYNTFTLLSSTELVQITLPMCTKICLHPMRATDGAKQRQYIKHITHITHYTSNGHHFWFQDN